MLRRTATAALLVLAVLVPALPAGGGRGAVRAASQAPDIVLILTDDQRYDEVFTMPTVKSQLAGKGMTFTRGFVVNPLCCPSRTTILTGRPSNSTGVYTNDPENHGGYPFFVDQQGSTVATWLDGAGYETALIGKYLNAYTVTDVPPGWDRWSAFIEPPTYYGYTLNEDGVLHTYGSAPEDYQTDVIAAQAVDFIRETPTTTPLFLMFTPFAPHGPTIPPPRYADTAVALGKWRLPNYDEADVSDKPAWVQKLPRIDAKEDARLEGVRRNRLRMLLGVDDAVAGILQALRDRGTLSNALIVFLSDNGYQLGAHRANEKRAPYEESIRVPFIVRYDPITQGTANRSAKLVLNMDLAPTFAALAGVSSPGAEGRSLFSILDGVGRWRRNFLVEHLLDKARPIPTFCAVRSRTYKYVEYSTGEEELYDLVADPYELQNLAGRAAYADVKASMHARLLQLCSPPPPGFTP